MKKIITVMITILMIVIIVNPGCKKKDDNGNGGSGTTSYFTFGQVGNVWVLRIYDNPPGTTWDYPIEIISNHGNGVFETLIWDSIPGYFFLTPTEWRDLLDENPEHGVTLLRNDAQVGTTYQYYSPADTIIVEVLSLNEQVTVAAGQFNCVKVRKDWKNYSGTGIDYAAYYWINYNYGLIKIETIYGTWDQELVSTNW